MTHLQPSTKKVSELSAHSNSTTSLFSQITTLGEDVRTTALKKTLAINGDHRLHSHIANNTRITNPSSAPKSALTASNNGVPALILLYHIWHGNPNWWFSMSDKDFERCQHKCTVTNNISLYQQADMVMFESPRQLLKQEGDKIQLGYFR